ncbi:hypothetical protein EZS27_010911 [termite gut metagenome]|uniref:Leucine-rich repeat domain-containing protein n=1 Tax=termite gut metagenome TaxID=433724 RepID=A0A5J4S556_9ZZZZ
MCKQLVYKKGLLLSLIISLFLLPFYSCQEDDNEIYRQLVGAPVQLKIVDKQDSGNRLYSIKNIINLTTGEAFYLNGQAQTKAGIGGDLNTEPRLKNKPYKIIPKYMVDAGERIDPDAIIGSFKKGDRIKVLVEIYEPEEGETLEEYVTTPLRRKIRVVEVVVDYNGKDEIDISVTDPAEEEFNETEITIHHEKGRLAEELGPINFKDGDNVRFIIFGEELTYTDMEVMRLYIHSLTGLELRNNITEIKESQFQYYYKLREVVFPEGITKIGHNAFQNCNSLFSINILNESSYKNNKITFIGEGAFQNCPLQGDLYIPENLTVCKYAFDGVSISLVMIEGNTNFICDPGEWIFYTNYLCQVSYGNPANYKGHNITANVDKFFRMDYENDGKSQLNMIFTNVYFYAGLNYIPKLHADLDFTKMSNKLKTNLIGAFHFETSNYFLTKHPIVSQYNYLYTYSIVFLADGVTTSNLNSLTNNSTCEIALYFRNEVTLPEGTCKGVTSIVLLPGTNKLKSDFLSCKSGIAKDCTIMLYQTEAITLSESMFTDVDLEKAITYVMHPGTPTLKLAQHTKLKAVEITEPMTSTGSLFRGTIFRQITLPYAIQEDKTFAPTLKTISPYAFADCPNLEVILGIDNVETIYREILARTPGIKFLSFYNLKNADSYALMESFVEILDLAGSPLDGDFNMYAFSKAYFLTYVSFVGTKIKTIPKGCFKDDDYLTSVIFGRGDTDYRDIPTQIRTRDGEFKSIPPVTGDYNTCPTLTSIEANAFENCMPLNIAIPSSVTSLGEEAFRGCASLKIGLYEGLKTIKKKCFFDCPGLVSINIPESVTTIEEGAFKTRNPQGLLHVRFNWKTKQTIQFYKSNVWPIGTMIVTIPSDPNVYGDAKYTDKI